MLEFKIGDKKVTIDDTKRTLCEVWTRVMGYFRPYSGFNIGKQQEFKDRKWFVESKITK